MAILLNIVYKLAPFTSIVSTVILNPHNLIWQQIYGFRHTLYIWYMFIYVHTAEVYAEYYSAFDVGALQHPSAIPVKQMYVTAL